MSKIQSLLDDILDELSTDIYYVYKDERHFFLEALTVAVATACLIEYVKGLLDPRAVGEAHRQYLKGFVENIRGGEMISIKAEIEALDKKANELLKSVQPDKAAERERVAIENLQAALIQIGMPSTQADLHSKNIALLVNNHLKA